MRLISALPTPACCAQTTFGELYYFEDGAQFFENGKFSREKLKRENDFYEETKMKVNGTLVNYYFHCKRQCWLHGNRINLESNSENVKIGKALHEIRAEESESNRNRIENIRLR